MTRIPSSLMLIAYYFLITMPFYAQTSHSITVKDNYRNWGWDSVFVAKNKYISVAVVPQAAGRILEFNLGEAPSLWLNPKLFGKYFAPNEDLVASDWRNFGGYRVVPIPVDNCAIGKDGKKTNRWPPPAIIGDNPYTVWISHTDTSKVIHAISGIQELPVPTYNGKTKKFIHPTTIDEALQYERSLHIEDESSRVFIKHTLHNKGNKAVQRGIMATSQHISQSSEDVKDGENFVAYIPFDEKLKLPNGHLYEITSTADNRWNFVNRNRRPLDKENPEHLAKYYNQGTNWTGEVAPGIFEIHYDYDLMSGFHIISSKSWICFVNKTDSTAFAKMFEPYDKSLNYEFGINMSIYVSGMETGYLETEVKTPIYDLDPQEYFEYQEIQAAAKIPSMPVLDVNEGGIITEKLHKVKNTNCIQGKYGVFVAGKAWVYLLNDKGVRINQYEIEEVNPLKSFILKFELPHKFSASSYQVIIQDRKQKSYLLDSIHF